MELTIKLDENINESLFLYNPDVILLVDSDYIIRLANPAANQRFNTDILSHNSHLIFNYIASKDIERFIQHFQKAMTGTFSKMNLEIDYQDGYITDSRMKLIPKIYNGVITGVFLVIEDMNNVRFNYDQLKNDEKLFRTMAENSLDIITIRDLEGNYLYASPSVKETLGYTVEEFIGTNRNQYVDTSYIDKQCQKLYDTNQICTLSYRIRRKDGNFIWLESTIKTLVDPISGQPISYLAISRDITARKKTEQLLLEKQARYQTLIEESPFATIILQRGKWVFVNDTAVQLLGGNNKEDIINRNPFDFIPSEFHDVIRARRRLLQKGKAVPLMFQQWKRLDGEIIEIEAKGIPTIFNGKSAVHIVVINVGERKKLYELARNTDKLSLIGQLSAGLAHEIRNPLTSIKGFIQLIEKGVVDKHYFDIIHSEFERIELILNELLFVAKPHLSIFKTHRLQDIVNHVVTLIHPQAILFNIELHTVQPDEPIQFDCDINQIKQLLLNLAKNAIEAMPNGGQLKIHLEVQSSYVLIRITDQGIGIPKELLEQIGQPFFTTKKKGTGLGMMISYQIVKNHKGRIEIKSKENHGTTFTIHLPLSSSVI